MPLRFDGVRQVLADAITQRVFPGATLELGRSSSPLWRTAVGTLSYDHETDPVHADTLYDLASLTKVIATTPLVMSAVERGTLRLDDPVHAHLADWRGADREGVTLRDLLEHASGLTAYLPFFRDHLGRVEFQRAICTLPLEYTPRSQSIYSDLGFMLLAFVLEDIAGASLAQQFQWISGMVQEPLLFNPPRLARPTIPPTEHDPWRGRLIQGEVHDENAWALGGAAGHAGLFGTVGAVGSFARLVLRGLEGDDTPLGRSGTIRAFATRSTVPGSSRALGWDTMLPTSSCGTRMSARAIGHTGFTGTSLWIDPEQDLYVALLSNRVHPTRENNAIQEVRRAVHDEIVAALMNS